MHRKIAFTIPSLHKKSRYKPTRRLACESSVVTCYYSFHSFTYIIFLALEAAEVMRSLKRIAAQGQKVCSLAFWRAVMISSGCSLHNRGDEHGMMKVRWAGGRRLLAPL
jgi:hypothetical protein